MRHLRRVNAALWQLLCAFFAGSLIGTAAGYFSHPLSIGGSAAGHVGLASVVWLPLTVLILGTSTVGYKMIPWLMLLRGYLLSASFSIILGSGAAMESALLSVGLPALFSLPAFFLLCEDAVSVSRIICLCSECSLVRRCSYIQPKRFILSVILLATAAAMQIYILPRIV